MANQDFITRFQQRQNEMLAQNRAHQDARAAGATGDLTIAKGDNEDDINRNNEWMRAQPWYQNLIQQYGGSNNLSMEQRQQIMQAAIQNGMQVNEGTFEIDEGGNFNKQGPNWKKIGLTAALLAAPAAAAFAIPALAGGGGTAAAGGTLPSTGFMGAASGLPTATGIGGTAAAGGGAAAGGSTLAGMVTAAQGSAPMGSLATTPGVALTGMDVATGTPAAAGSLGGGGSWIDKLLGKVKGTDGDGWADLGKVIGGYGQAEATNRFLRGNFMQNYDRLNMDAAELNMKQESDAMRKLGQVGYIMGGGNPYTAPRLNSGQTVDLGWGPKAPSAIEQQGASNLVNTLLKRTTPEGQVRPTDPTTYTQEGTGEKVGKYGGLIAGGLGAFNTFFR